MPTGRGADDGTGLAALDRSRPAAPAPLGPKVAEADAGDWDGGNDPDGASTAVGRGATPVHGAGTVCDAATQTTGNLGDTAAGAPPIAIAIHILKSNLRTRLVPVRHGEPTDAGKGLGKGAGAPPHVNAKMYPIAAPPPSLRTPTPSLAYFQDCIQIFDYCTYRIGRGNVWGKGSGYLCQLGRLPFQHGTPF